MKLVFSCIFLFFSFLSYSQSDYALANDYFRKGEYEKALTYYQNLIQRNPFNSFYVKRLITCYQETDQFDKAEESILNTISANPTNTYWFVELGYNYDRQQNDSIAQIQYQKALEAIREKPSVGALTGRFFRDNNLLDKAVAAYELAMETDPNLDFSFQLARIYGEQGEFDRMFKAYVNLIDRNDSYLGTVQRYTSSYLTDDPANKYNVSFKRALLKKSISNPKVAWNQLLSWLFTKQGEYSKAFVQEKAIYARSPEDLGNIFVLGKIAFNNSRFEEAKEIFEFLLEKGSFIEEKLDAELYLLKIAIVQKKSDVEQLFQDKLKQYGYTSNTIYIQKAYADYLTFNRNKPDEAEKILKGALSLANSKFEKARIKLKLGEVLVFTGQFNTALINFSQVQTQLKNHPLGQQARFKVAETSFFKGDFSWAKTQLKVLKGSTSQLIANDAVDLFLVISDNEPMDSIKTGLTDFAKARLLVYQNKKSEAAVVLEQILKDYRGQNIEDDCLFELAKIYISTDQYELAVAQLLKIIEIDKAGVYIDDAYYLLAETYINHLNDKEKASEYYQKIIFEQASSIYLVDARKKFRKLRGDVIN